MAGTPVPTGFILNSTVCLFLSRIPSPWGQTSTLRETERWVSQDIPSCQFTQPARDQNRPTPIPDVLLTPCNRHPHADTHPALPLWVAPGLLFRRGPQPLCSFPLHFNPPTKARNRLVWALGSTSSSQESGDSWFLLCIQLEGPESAVYNKKQRDNTQLRPGMKQQ